MANSSAYKPGALVSARGREWVALPNSDPETLLLRPPGGTDAEIVEVSEEVESVTAAAYPPPDASQAGDFQSCGLLRDAVRLGLRASTGPFRSFAHIAVEPRPYQLVPLLMAMRQETTRLLIADDAGIGKTVEALLIARELLDRGEIGRIAVLCPPQLAGQWQAEMASKFSLPATLIMPSTARRLEDGLLPRQSLFDKYPFTVISLDFVKGDERRGDFARACPEFVIVDEAHTCAASGPRHQRNALISALAQDKNRHLVLVTATPHSGKDDSFRSLLAFLGEDFGDFNQDRNAKRRLAARFIQRGRGDILDGRDSPFPERKSLELAWQASPKWKKLFDDTLELCRAIHTKAKATDRERSCWLASLIMLRAISSSPEAALQAFENRLVENDTELATAAAESVFDADISADATLSDFLPGANTGDMKDTFSELAKAAKALSGKNDPKLTALLKILVPLINDGYAPIIFCRFIPTATYLAGQLRKMLPEDVAIAAITGKLEQSLREAAVKDLAASDKRVLIATDCLSEGINLQSGFNAVIHYDLAWNPGRHEQREGRVDRFGQPSREVRVITWYGRDNPMDGMVLDVLLRKHEKIRKSLGHAVPTPVEIEKVLETLVAGMLLRKKQASQNQLPLLPELADWLEAEKLRVAADWDKAVEREAARSRSLFRQSSIRPEQALEAANAAAASLGDGSTVREFVLAAWEYLGGGYKTRRINDVEIFTVNFDSAARQCHPGLDLPKSGAKFRFEPRGSNSEYLCRTHPHVEALASYLAQTSLDAKTRLLPRCGVCRAGAVKTLTTLLLCRFRFQIGSNESLAEECLPVAFEGNARLADERAIALMGIQPEANCDSEEVSYFLEDALARLPELKPGLASVHLERAEILLAAHNRDRAKKCAVKPLGAPDVIGLYVCLPLPPGAVK